MQQSSSDGCLVKNGVTKARKDRQECASVEGTLGAKGPISQAASQATGSQAAGSQAAAAVRRQAVKRHRRRKPAWRQEAKQSGGMQVRRQTVRRPAARRQLQSGARQPGALLPGCPEGKCVFGGLGPMSSNTPGLLGEARAAPPSKPWAFSGHRLKTG